MQSSAQLLESYSRLKLVLGNEQALELINFLDARDDEQQESNGKTMATKADILELKSELRVEIEKSKSEMLKWMFIFWVGQAATTVGIILVVLKH